MVILNEISNLIIIYMAEKSNDYGLACVNNIWFVYKEKKVIQLGRRYVISGDFIIGTQEDGTKTPVYLKTFQAYESMQECFFVKGDRLVYETCGVWKMLCAKTNVRIPLGIPVEKGNRSFVYYGERGMKLTQIRNVHVHVKWTPYAEKKESIWYRCPPEQEELIAV